VDQLDLDIKESIYDSNKNRPVGKSHDQRDRLPPQIDPDCTAFGKPSDKSKHKFRFAIIIKFSLRTDVFYANYFSPGISAGLLVNPPKSRQEVAAEAKCCRNLYKVTHGDFNPGEQLCRK
jgi:hypothetical protein